MHIGMVLSKYKDKYVINLLQLDINNNSSNTQVVELGAMKVPLHCVALL